MLGESWRFLRQLLDRLPIAGTTVLLVSFFMLFWRLGSSQGSLRLSEKLAVYQSSSLNLIFEHPLNAPHKLLQLGLSQINNSVSTGLVRSASALVALSIVIALFTILKNWFGGFCSTLGILLLLGTPLFLILGRSATTYITLLLPLLPLALFVARDRLNWRRETFMALVVILVAITLYSPASLWILASIGIVYRKSLRHELKKLSRLWKISLALFFILMISPLLVKQLSSLSGIEQWLFLPTTWPGPIEAIKDLAWAPISLTLHAHNISPYLLGLDAVLSLTAGVLGLIGAAALYNQSKRDLWPLVIYALIGFILYGLSDFVPVLLIILPVVILLATAGLRYLFVEWKSVFPKNPIPHGVAVILMLVVCLQQLLFGYIYAHTAWPRNQELTQQQPTTHAKITNNIGE